ncbi:antifreeze protein [Mycena crocata]|nr:antifreeze protein [Mycena crocata]
MFSSLFATFALSTVYGAAALGPAAVNLRTAANYAVLAKSGIASTPPSIITGAIAVSPITATAITGFSLILDSTNQFSTSPQVSGHIFAASYAAPTPSILTVAVGDMGTAFTDASSRLNPNFTNLASGAIGGLILVPGLYKWTSAVVIGNDIILAGSATDTWIFQITGTLNIGSGKKIVLAGGAVAKNIVWVVTGAVTAASNSHLEGVILGKTGISLQTGATANSRLLAQTSVSLQKACFATVNN